jgi:hypothetical protein
MHAFKAGNWIFSGNIKETVSGNNSDKNAKDEALFRHHIGIVLVVYEGTWSCVSCVGVKTKLENFLWLPGVRFPYEQSKSRHLVSCLTVAEVSHPA